MFKGVIGKESTVTHTNWEKVIFGTSVVSTITFTIDCDPPTPNFETSV